jgi:5'-3' exoribonuclease 2
MGVASFFRWVVARYPKALQPAVEEEPVTDPGDPERGNCLEDNRYLHIDVTLPNPNGEEFDNLYLDLNGIVHTFTHPEDHPPPATEDDMFQDIFRYIDRIVALVRPRRLLYIAIDGVAPRAKINQQRSRRFRAAREAREKEEEEDKLRALWKEQGLKVPPKPKKPFDSNVITPGTPFMGRLAAALRLYVRNRLESCAAWRSLVVIFSDASVPGEGEHKIAEFIRTQRAQPGYDPQTSHVLYGLDADLLMLALATHEPRFMILRERVYFDYRANKAIHAVKNMNEEHRERNDEPQQGAEDKSGSASAHPLPTPTRPFDFFRIDYLRAYLEAEFRAALTQTSKTRLEEPLDTERIIDDFVFLCFFVGNDFLPHLPSLEIREGAIDFLLEVYKSQFFRVGYLTDGRGGIHFDRVRQLLQEVARVEDDVFQERARLAHSSENQSTTSSVNAPAPADPPKQKIEQPLIPTKEEVKQTLIPASQELDARSARPSSKLSRVIERPLKPGLTETDPGLELVPLPRKHVKENRASTMRSWKRLDGEQPRATVVASVPNDTAASELSSASYQATMPRDAGTAAASGPTTADPSATGDREANADESTTSAAATESHVEFSHHYRRKRRRVPDAETEHEPADNQTGSLGQDMASADDRQHTTLDDDGDASGVETGSIDDSGPRQAIQEETPSQASVAREPRMQPALSENVSTTDLADPSTESEDSDNVLEEVLDHYTDEEGRHFEQVLRERLKNRQAQPNSMADPVHFHLPGWKERYYRSKFPQWPASGVEAGSPELRRLCHAYYEGLLWVFRYYYAGCPSWGWFYPYHYAPFASDLVQYPFQQTDAAFERGAPFTPLEQLMAVLPASSGAQCLPAALYALMIDQRSPIIDYYPADFAIDLNGKKFAWQGVVLLPFVDEHRLRAAMQAVIREPQSLEGETDPEKRRMLRRADPEKAFGAAMLFAHRDSDLGSRLRQVLADVERGNIGLKLDGQWSNGVFGRVLRPSQEVSVCKEEFDSFGDGLGTEDHSSVQEAVVFGIWTNAKHLPHVPQLLPGTKQPATALDDTDLYGLLAGRAGWKCARFGVLGQAAEALRRQRLTEASKATPDGHAMTNAPATAVSWFWSWPQPGGGSASTMPPAWPWANAAAPGTVGADGPKLYPTNWWPNQTTTVSAPAAGFHYPSWYGDASAMQQSQAVAYGLGTTPSGYPANQEAMLSAYYGSGGPWTTALGWAPAMPGMAPTGGSNYSFGHATGPESSRWFANQSLSGTQGASQGIYPPVRHFPNQTGNSTARQTWSKTRRYRANGDRKNNKRSS